MKASNRNTALLLRLVLFCILVVGSVGCGSKRLDPAGTVRVVVLDGVMVGEAAETRRSQTGYWLSRRDRFDSGNAGILVGEILSRDLAELPGVNVFSRTDLASYMAQKERLVARSFSELTPEERRGLLERMDPLDYGRSLNVDFVIRPRVTRSRMIHNRAFSVWYSRADIELELWDVNAEALIWVWDRSDARWFGSQMSAIEKVSRRATREVAREDLFRLGY